jgi:hypothetical protein
MNRLILARILAAPFALAATAAPAQNPGAESNPNIRPVRAYTTAGPAAAGVYREEPQPTNPGSTQQKRHVRQASHRRARPEILSN